MPLSLTRPVFLCYTELYISERISSKDPLAGAQNVQNRVFFNWFEKYLICFVRGFSGERKDLT